MNNLWYLLKQPFFEKLFFFDKEGIKEHCLVKMKDILYKVLNGLFNV
jgi:hypothetical protein